MKGTAGRRAHAQRTQGLAAGGILTRISVRAEVCAAPGEQPPCPGDSAGGSGASPGHRSGDELLEAAGRRPLGRPRQRELRGFCGRGICLMNGSLERRDGPCLHTKLQAKIGLV